MHRFGLAKNIFRGCNYQSELIFFFFLTKVSSRVHFSSRCFQAGEEQCRKMHLSQAQPYCRGTKGWAWGSSRENTAEETSPRLARGAMATSSVRAKAAAEASLKWPSAEPWEPREAPADVGTPEVAAFALACGRLCGREPFPARSALGRRVGASPLHGVHLKLCFQNSYGF